MRRTAPSQSKLSIFFYLMLLILCFDLYTIPRFQIINVRPDLTMDNSVNDSLNMERTLSSTSVTSNLKATYTRYSHKWTILDFESKMELKEFNSSKFIIGTSIGDVVCKVFLLPNGVSEAEEGYMSVFLEMESQNWEPWRVEFYSIRAFDEYGCEIKDDANDDRRKELEFPGDEGMGGIKMGMGFHNFLSHKCLERNAVMSSGASLILVVDIVPAGNVKIVEGSGDFNLSTAAVKKLSVGIKSSFIAGKYTDCIIKCADQEFACHRIILSAMSRVFDAVFTHNMEKKKQKQIEIKDFGAEVVADMLNFIYSSQVQQLRIKAADLLPVADKYDLQTLKHMCESSLCENINTGNVLEILMLSYMYHCPMLRSHALDYIVLFKKEIVDHGNWREKLRHHVDIIADMFESVAV